MSTVTLGLWIPKLVNKFGDKMVDLKFKILPLSSCQMTDDEIKCTVNFDIWLLIEGETILSATFKSSELYASLYSMNGLIKGDVDITLGQM